MKKKRDPSFFESKKGGSLFFALKKEDRELNFAHLVKLVYTTDLKSVPVFLGYRFKSDSEQKNLGDKNSRKSRT